MVELNIKVPDGFLDDEIRCGYTVTAEMKKVWAVELDLLDIILKVCQKHNIRIFASGGTMLGAVRHKGFIPWDDDIDLMMFRADYDKLCEIAEAEFKYPYFFQTEFTDPGSLRGHAQLRNSMTTAILKKEVGQYKFNQGIFIDIFPLDNVVDNEQKFQEQAEAAEHYKKLSRRYASISTRYLPDDTGIKAFCKSIAHKFLSDYFFKKEQQAYTNYENVCKKYNSLPTEKISTLSFQFSNIQHIKYRADYLELIDVPFEFMTIPIGKNYDHALKTRYGDYMTIVKGGSEHGGVILDPDNSYTNKL